MKTTPLIIALMIGSFAITVKADVSPHAPRQMDELALIATTALDSGIEARLLRAAYQALANNQKAVDRLSDLQEDSRSLSGEELSMSGSGISIFTAHAPPTTEFELIIPLDRLKEAGFDRASAKEFGFASDLEVLVYKQGSQKLLVPTGALRRIVWEVVDYKLRKRHLERTLGPL